MNAAIYARVSTEIQAEQGYSLATQVDACRKLATDLGADATIEYVDDGYSGASLDRPKLDELRDALKLRAYDVVVCYTPDRLARKLALQLIITEEIEKSGAKLAFVQGDYKDNPEGRLFYQMQGAFAEYEREKIRERLLRGKRGKLKTGRPVQDSHVYGYDFDKGKCEYTINKAEAAIVRRIFDDYVHGRIAMINIARYLEAEGIPSKYGTRWNVCVISDILHRSMYTGEYYSQTQYHKCGPGIDHKEPRPRDEWIEMRCPAIIDREIFDAAQQKCAEARHFLPPKKHPNLMQGLVWCGVCGKKMTVREAGAGGHRYYVCYPYARRLMEYEEKCKNRYIRVDAADDMLWSMLVNLAQHPRKLEKAIKQSEQPKAQDADRDRLTRRLDRIKKDRAATLEWHSTGLIEKADAEARLAKLKADETALKAQLDAMPKKPSGRVDVDKIRNAILNCDDTFDARRAVVLQTIEKITLYSPTLRLINIDVVFRRF